LIALYEKHKVKEYWLVNGDIPSVVVYRPGLDGFFKKPDYYCIDKRVSSTVLAGEEIPLVLFVRKK